MSTLTTTKTTPHPQVFTEMQVIEKVRSYVLERRVALSLYRFSEHSSEKIQVIDEMLYTLDVCKWTVDGSPKNAIRLVLRCQLNLHFIAPTKTRKMHITWYEKIEEVMQACREYLNLRKQIKAA